MPATELTREQLLAELDQLRDFYQHSPVASFSVDLEGRIRRCNQRAGELIGCPAQNLLGKPVLELYNDGPQGKQAAEKILARFRAGESIFGEELQMKKVDGSVIWISLSVNPVRDHAGQVTESRSLVLDISEKMEARVLARVHYDLAMHLSVAAGLEETLRLCLDAAMSVAGMDVGGVYLVDKITGGLNLQISKGLSLEAQKTAGSLAVDSPNTRMVMKGQPVYLNYPQGQGLLDERMKKEGLVSTSVFPILFDGTVIACLNVASRSVADVPVAIRRALEMITSQMGNRIIRAQTEEALRVSEDRFRTLFEQSPISVVFSDMAGNIITCNQQFTKQHATREGPQKQVGRSVSEFVAPEDLPLLNANIEATIKKDRSDRGPIKFTMLKEDGSRFPVEAVSTVVRDKKGEPIALLAHAWDISGPEQLEQQLQQAQKMESVGRLAGGVAHDFNNLLTAILGAADLMAVDMHAADPLLKGVQQIMQAGRRAADLTHQLLAFSRRQILKAEILDLNSVVSEILSMLRRLIGEDIEIVLALDPDPCLVKVDRGQFEQILMNLSVNARDAMPNGGRLTFETTAVDLDQQDGVEPAGHYLMLTVSDTGEGMDQATMQKIFEPFFSTKEMGKGTGLGLSMVYGIVKQSGGSIFVDSEPGRGSSFKIYLPATKKQAEAVPSFPGPEQVQIHRRSETIMVVEDEDVVLNLAVEILHRENYTVLQARTAEEALLLLQENANDVDLLLTDVVLTGMSGAELARKVVAQSPRTKVLYMSGYTDDAITQHGVLREGVAFVQKPFTLNLLTRKVRMVLAEERNVIA